ncbi:hypothetical protein LCGC14_2300250, partial [marine sediment metagenome]
ISFALTAGLLLVASFWFLLSRLTGPLNDLATASERLGRGAASGDLPVVGPTEVQDLTRAFNIMQDRLTRFVSDRTQMLAALAHDLRSPLTALRVRAEMVDEEDTRTSLVASSEEMQRMVDATLDFAKGVGQHEEVQSVDLHELITGMGLDKVQVTNQGPLIVSVKPSAMGRALRNLIENAIRYGNEARVSWQRMGSDVVVTIDDQGQEGQALLPGYGFDDKGDQDGDQDIQTGRRYDEPFEKEPCGKGSVRLHSGRRLQ